MPGAGTVIACASENIAYGLGAGAGIGCGLLYFHFHFSADHKDLENEGCNGYFSSYVLGARCRRDLVDHIWGSEEGSADHNNQCARDRAQLHDAVLQVQVREKEVRPEKLTNCQVT